MSSAQYSIGVTTNRFELFDLGDEDPLELIKKQQLEKEAKKKAKLTEKEVPKPKAPVAPKPKVDKKPAKDFQGAHDGHKTRDDSAKPPRDDRKLNPDFKNQRNPNNNREDREKENYRSREDQDRGARDNRDGDDGFKRGNSEFGRRGGRGGGAGGGNNNGFRGRTFQRGGTGGGGRPYPPEFKGKRDMDRQSGSNKTGVKSMDKREGSGGHNWGNAKDDLQAHKDDLNLSNSNDKENWDSSNNVTSASEEWTSPTENNQWNPEGANSTVPPTAGSQSGEAVAATDGTENAELSADPDAPKEELTLDEWKAKKAPKVAPSYNLRKAGEGEDLTQWKKMYALRKKKENEDDDDEEYEYIDYPQRVGRQRHILDIDIRYKDSRGGNTGRGRGRGRGAGGFRGPPQERGTGPGAPPPRDRESYNSASTKEIPKVDDEHDFPSLG